MTEAETRARLDDIKSRTWFHPNTTDGDKLNRDEIEWLCDQLEAALAAGTSADVVATQAGKSGITVETGVYGPSEALSLDEFTRKFPYVPPFEQPFVELGRFSATTPAGSAQPISATEAEVMAECALANAAANATATPGANVGDALVRELLRAFKVQHTCTAMYGGVGCLGCLLAAKVEAALPVAAEKESNLG